MAETVRPMIGLASGELTPTYTPITFEEIPASLDRLHRGEADGRLVAIPA